MTSSIIDPADRMTIPFRRSFREGMRPRNVLQKCLSVFRPNAEFFFLLFPGDLLFFRPVIRIFFGFFVTTRDVTRL